MCILTKINCANCMKIVVKFSMNSISLDEFESFKLNRNELKNKNKKYDILL